MSGINHITPPGRSNWVQPKKKRQRRETGTGKKDEPDHNRRPDKRPDDSDHKVDELA